jgi:hypothetical protein
MYGAIISLELLKVMYGVFLILDYRFNYKIADIQVWIIGIEILLRYQKLLMCKLEPPILNVIKNIQKNFGNVSHILKL